MVRWLPLESNPAIMNKLLVEIGVKKGYSFTDVYGLDEGLLAMVPQPVGAMILLFPLNDKEEEFRHSQQKDLSSKGQEVSSNVYYMKQYVGNACGTVALIHSLANCPQIDLGSGPLKKFIDDTKSMNQEERGHHLENFDGIADAHDKLAHEGQTEAPDKDAKLDLHFVTLVHVDGNVYELDGRKETPINHGPTTPENFLNDAAKVCQGFMERNPEESRFAMIALAKDE